MGKWTEWLQGWQRTAAAGGVSLGPAEPALQGPEEDAPALDTFPAPLTLSDAQGLLDLRRIEGWRSPDCVALGRLIQAAADYRWQIQHRLPTDADLRVLVEEVPKGATLAQKYLWGLWQGGRMVGCLDVIRGWPQPGHLTVGLLLLDPAVRRQGLGHRALTLLAARTRPWREIHAWRLGVVETHQSAMQFWRHEGFRPTGARDPHQGLVAPLVIMERRVRR